MKLTAADYYERALTSSQEGDDKGAIADLNRAIRSDPRMAIAYFLRGDIKRSCGDAQSAVADFTIGIKLDPKCVPAYVCRGNARRNLGDTKGAIADCNRALKLDANNVSAYIGLGMARSQNGTDSAINDFNKAIQLDPKSSEAYFGRGVVRADKGETKEAISDFTKAIKLNPQHGMAYMLRGEAYRVHSKTDKAIADFTKAIEMGVPNWAHAYGNRGSERAKKGDYVNALKDFDTAIDAAIEFDPKLGLLYLGRGTAYLESGNTGKGTDDLIIAVKLDSSLKSLVDPLLVCCTTPAKKKVRIKRVLSPKQEKCAEPGRDVFNADLVEIEQEMKVCLDDKSIPLLAQLRAKNLLTKSNWKAIRSYLRRALASLAEQNQTSKINTDGTIFFEADSDPRDADWLRIVRAMDLAGYALPGWAALWLWWLRTDRSRKFWLEVGSVAHEMGYKPLKPSGHKRRLA